MQSERELVLAYKNAYDQLNEADEAYKKCDEAFNEAKVKLIEDMEARNATSTAKYEGIGRVSLLKPELFASVKKENQELLFDYLKSIGREDLIKPSVHHRSLSSFIGELTEKGEAPPEFITVGFKKVTRLNQ